MEKSGKWPIVESPHILGQIYRAVDTKNFYKECMRSDHARSILLEYPLNMYILTKGGTNFIKKTAMDKSKVIEPEWHSYLSSAYEEIVVPMNEEIRQIMIQYKILNEGELYCTNLEFNLEDDK